MTPKAEDRLWQFITWGSGCAALLIGVYDTYHAGWRGFAYSILAGTFGYMATYYMGHMMPGADYILRKKEHGK